MIEIRTVAVVGAGTMGHGIAQAAAQAGCAVRLADAVSGAAQQALVRIRKNLDGAIERGKLTAAERDAVLARISALSDPLAAADGADLVIEAIPEQLDLKRDLFRALGERLPAPVVLATNTSSLSVAAIAAAAKHPERVIGMHFFNPVHIMKLVEIVVHETTGREAREGALALVRAMGKEPIVVKDSPGFASSRLGIALGLEAMRMLEAGVASAEDIDKAMVLGYNHPMGPLRLTDLVGLDVRLAIARYLFETLDSPVFRPPAILERMVEEGRLGRKSGRGFYSWTDA
ncbi:MAG: 3-hydroxyacyl-CoA dehydrogenase family protein [Gemmatimonadales bacterium]